MRRRHLLSLLAAPLVACQREGPRFHGIDMTGASYGRDFEVMAADGRKVRLADFHGSVVLLFFGFTQCPDICPTALTRAAAVRELLGDQAERLQVLFLTIDPERDTPELLRAYTEAFDPSFLGLYADAERTAYTAAEFKIYYKQVPTGASYTMDHSTQSYVFDPQGRLRLLIKHEAPAAEVADDVRLLLTA